MLLWLHARCIRDIYVNDVIASNGMVAKKETYLNTYGELLVTKHIKLVNINFKTLYIVTFAIR